MDEIIKNPIETVPTPELQPEAKLTKYERKKVIIKRLGDEFKELYGADSPIIIDMAAGRYGYEEAQARYKGIDIVVQATKGQLVDELRGYLNSQDDFKLIKEGEGIVLSADNYVAFHLKLNDEEKPKMALDKLKIIMDYLDEVGLYGSKYTRNVEKVRKSLLNGSTVPLVIPGGNGIRLTYDKAADQLKVIFVEGFSDPTFPLRKRVEAWLRDNF